MGPDCGSCLNIPIKLGFIQTSFFCFTNLSLDDISLKLYYSIKYLSDYNIN